LLILLALELLLQHGIEISSLSFLAPREVRPTATSTLLAVVRYQFLEFVDFLA
jgi:hypothetical protein